MGSVYALVTVLVSAVLGMVLGALIGAFIAGGPGMILGGGGLGFAMGAWSLGQFG